MLCHSMGGVPVPTLFLLPVLKNLPIELEEFSRSGEAFFTSYSKGWVTRELFIAWTLQFIEFLSGYRMRLCIEQRDRPFCFNLNIIKH
ncbi:hypothetical protein TVAGG3_0134620 [Trichomonas vaginalis G3]|uniref:hypothetical protein n=1 Tax=Trichomonas vaginalis (strain ATCC PRA-98 / G3) TaxID=412133 RepID=UPI0021E564AE|nr:hypothetical protein TVAGG3_0134620 [Trichomonas vaginalis G3]KAI5546312.1 hypothetical protein TVAGG3_0134620 [Trichomonas vaginalis G3]